MSVTITTPLYYVNDKPHLGSTYTTIACDAYARFQRLNGKKVNFITGVDEHGQKIQRTAASKNISPQEHCDLVSKEYINLWELWSISNDKFVRTTSQTHKLLVNQFFERVLANGDVRIGHQKGWYCVGCEEYKDNPPTEQDPICPIHQKRLEWRDEENLFFCLSKYQKEIETLVSKPNFIRPSSRKNEISSFVSKGLKDFSISRVNLDWGIPVPGHKGHTFYVWFDALLGYISALAPNNTSVDLDQINKYGWPPAIHFIGKDILRFHAIYWPAMLMSAGLELPSSVFGHGFLTREGQKMGKTLGNILDPKELLCSYGCDRIRWYLLKDIKFGNDGDFQTKRFLDLVNNDLANTIGNLLNRTITMSRKWFNGAIPTYKHSENSNKLELLSNATCNQYKKAMNDLAFNDACDRILNLASDSNLYLNDNEPWRLIKDTNNYEKVAECIYSVLETSRIIGILLSPILPELSFKILEQLSVDQSNILFDSDIIWGQLQQGKPLIDPTPIIQKL